MAVEFISSPIPKICDQAEAQTYNPGIEVRLTKKTTDAIPSELFYRSTAQ